MGCDKKKWALEILEKLQDEYPDAGTMLKYSSPFELLTAVVLSAQSTDAQVNRVTSELFKTHNTPEQFASMNESELQELIHGVGLYKSKARNIINLSEKLLHNYKGDVPSDFDSLIKLPGVGRKTANVIMSVAFNLPGLGVDTHVQRVSSRLGLAAENNPDKTEKALKEIIPISCWSWAHHLLIFHGRKICTSRNPKCPECVVNNLCRKIINKY